MTNPAAGPAAVGSTTVGAVLVGRDAELEELRAAAAAAVARSRSLVALICGDAGVGKTRLAAEVAEVLAADGVAVARGVCRHDGGAPPYWPWAQLLDRLGRRGRARRGAAETTGLARFALFEAVGAALSAAAPVLLVLDDLQWADRPSLRLLDALVAHVGDAAVLVLGTYRDTDPDAGRLAGITADRRLVLRGLPRPTWATRSRRRPARPSGRTSSRPYTAGPGATRSSRRRSCASCARRVGPMRAPPRRCP